MVDVGTLWHACSARGQRRRNRVPLRDHDLSSPTRLLANTFADERHADKLGHARRSHNGGATPPEYCTPRANQSKR